MAVAEDEAVLAAAEDEAVMAAAEDEAVLAAAGDTDRRHCRKSKYATPEKQAGKLICGRQERIMYGQKS